MANVLIIPDTQYPFHHKDSFKFLAHLKDKYPIDKVIHIGDLFDFHALSDYPTDPDSDSVGGEFTKALKHTKKLYELFPEATLLESNHDARFHKRLAKAGIPTRFWPKFKDIFEFPDGWEFKNKEVVDDVVYVHGHQIRANGGNVQQNAMRNYMRSVVFGHFHTRFGIDYHANEDMIIFGMSVGCLIDHTTYAFAYQRQSTRKPLLGAGLVFDGIPMLIPMTLNKSGRWVGK